MRWIPNKVYLRRRKTSPNWYFVWRDENLKQQLKSAGTKNKREAERLAAAFENDLRAGKQKASEKQDETVLTFEQLAEAYESNASIGKSKSYLGNIRTAMAMIRDVAPVRNAKQLNQAWADKLKREVYKKDLRPSTKHGYIKRIKHFLKWSNLRGHCEQLILDAEREQVSTYARGEPFGPETFERIIDAVVLVMGGQRRRYFEDFIKGLWLSGFRLRELHSLRPCEGLNARDPFLNMAGDFPTIIFPTQKNKQQLIWPVPPDFEQHLRSFEHGDEFVFQLPSQTSYATRGRCNATTFMHHLRLISRRANAVVLTSDNRERFVSSHDFRRAFTHRWYLKTNDLHLTSRLTRANVEVLKRHYMHQSAASIHERLSALDSGLAEAGG